jgi:hypothetical protein
VKAPKLGVTASRDPVAVVSKTVLPAIVAAAIFVSAACGALGLMMLVTENRAGEPAVRVPAEKVTVSTLDVRVGAAVVAPPAMPE